MNIEQYENYLISVAVILSAILIAFIVIEYDVQEDTIDSKESFCNNEEFAKIDSVYRKEVCKTS